MKKYKMKIGIIALFLLMIGKMMSLLGEICSAFFNCYLLKLIPLEILCLGGLYLMNMCLYSVANTLSIALIVFSISSSV